MRRKTIIRLLQLLLWVAILLMTAIVWPEPEPEPDVDLTSGVIRAEVVNRWQR